VSRVGRNSRLATIIPKSHDVRVGSDTRLQCSISSQHPRSQGYHRNTRGAEAIVNGNGYSKFLLNDAVIASVRASLFSAIPPDTNHSPSTAISTTKQKTETGEQRSTATRCRTSRATSELRGTHRVVHLHEGLRRCFVRVSPGFGPTDGGRVRKRGSR
jgi:hypothetical protein